jgi:hypothetical protein
MLSKIHAHKRFCSSKEQRRSLEDPKGPNKGSCNGSEEKNTKTLNREIREYFRHVVGRLKDEASDINLM